YGHHRRFGEMALAAAVRQIETDGSAALTNYGAFLAAHPPTDEVEIHERTSWSCAHGVERWRADCGCRTRSDWQQRWRAPLREALDWLRDQIDPFFEARAGAHLKDPWAARDTYIEVVLDPSPARLDAFFAAHQRTPLDAAARVEIRRLLELARHRLLMYTSCGWFFDEISGLFDDHPAEARIYTYRVARLDESREASDDTALRIARVRVSALATGETREMMYALVHYGSHDFACGTRAWEDEATYDALRADLLRRWAQGSVADVVRGMDEHFPGEPFALAHLF